MYHCLDTLHLILQSRNLIHHMRQVFIVSSISQSDDTHLIQYYLLITVYNGIDVRVFPIIYISIGKVAVSISSSHVFDNPSLY